MEIDSVIKKLSTEKKKKNLYKITLLSNFAKHLKN